MTDTEHADHSSDSSTDPSVHSTGGEPSIASAASAVEGAKDETTAGDDAETGDTGADVAQVLPGGGKLDGPAEDELADEAGGPIQVP